MITYLELSDIHKRLSLCTLPSGDTLAVIPVGDFDALFLEVEDLQAEIRRHHRDFERWEDMAAKGANQVETLKRYKKALQDIVNASRDDGLASMINWIRGRAAAALLKPEDAK